LADYEYYENVADSIYVFTTAVDSNSLGSFSTTVTVPGTADMDYGDYFVYAYDAVGNADDAAFTIGPVISLSIDEGPVGSVVEIRGRGFDPAQQIDAGEITIDGVVCWIEDAPVDIDDDGEFRLDIVIPQVDEAETKTITVNEAGGADVATADFEVTGLAEIELEPEYGAPGDTVTIYGYNFTQIRGVDVIVFIDEDDDGVLDAGEQVGTFETTAEGEFTGTFTVPAFATETYDVIARQADYNIEDSDSFRIGLMYVILSPTEGATGDLVTITGVGFTVNEWWNATFNGIAITDATEPVSAEGTLLDAPGVLKTFYVPTVEPGTYTITVLDIASGIEVTTTFEVTETTTVTITPSEAPNEYTVTIKGYNFVDVATWAAASLEFTLWNETEDWDITAEIYDEEWDTEGNFTAKWDIWSSDDLELGTYYINVTDGEGLYATATLEIVEAIVECTPRLTEYHIGDTIAFDIKSSFPKVDPADPLDEGSWIEIYDPDDNLYWKTDEFTEDKWLEVDLYFIVPYYEQVAAGNPMTLPPDAPTGTWSWTWYDYDGDELANGTFTVLPAVEVLLEERIASVEESLEVLSEDVAGLSEDVAGVKSDIADLKTDVAAATSAAEAAEEAASAAQEAVAEVADVASAAKAAAEEAKTAAEEAKTAATGLTPLIYGAIGVSLVAALAAIVSLIQISRRIAG
jgi:hypothetical protein